MQVTIKNDILDLVAPIVGEGQKIHWGDSGVIPADGEQMVKLDIRITKHGVVVAVKSNGVSVAEATVAISNGGVKLLGYDENDLGNAKPSCEFKLLTASQVKALKQ